MTGIANVGLAQLHNFHISLAKYSDQNQQATNWLEAFQLLIKHLEADTRTGKK